MTRPLYLDPSRDWTVSLDAGPSLHVRAPGRARTLFQIRTLSRIVSPTCATWSSEALIACLRAGVPVLFSDASGEVVGWCFGSRKRETTIASLLRLALDEPDGPIWIEDWRHSSARREVIGAMRELGMRYPTLGDKLDTAGARSLLCNWHRQRMGEPVSIWLQSLERHVEALAARTVLDYVGDPALIGYPVPGLHLGIVLAGLLQWRLHRIIAASAVHEMLNARSCPGRWAAASVEAHSASLYCAAGAIMGHLEAILRERLG